MNFDCRSSVAEEAKALLRNASSGYGIKASLENKDNYNRIWARDSAVSGLAILSSGLEDLYPALQSSLSLLQSAAAANGQIPSNISLNENGEITAVSFGVPAGRTDAGFWWIIAAVSYLQVTQDEHFKPKVKQQCDAGFSLAKSWEFNGKGLMYVPMSSNWADEYVTHGYVLYDQVLRYWALSLAADFYENSIWKQEAAVIKAAIKQHFLLETSLEKSLYTQAQQDTLQDFDGHTSFIASFSPGDRVEKFDAWSIALLLLLDIPSAETNAKLKQAVLTVFEETNHIGIPAFWPMISEQDQLYQVLSLNHNYQFKNKPGHFHNGGIWPVVNGFLIAGLTVAGEPETAKLLMNALQKNLASFSSLNPFTEYLDMEEGLPSGVKNLCFSASGFLIALEATGNQPAFSKIILPKEVRDNNIFKTIRPAAAQILDELDFSVGEVLVIAVSGESGSGKTTLAKAFKSILSAQNKNVLLLHQDDYFRLPPQKNHQARLKNLGHIGPQEVRLELLDEHMRNIKKRLVKEVSVPRMNWETDIEEKVLTNVENINVVVVEGTYVQLLQEADYRIYINTHHSQTYQNRVSRGREKVTEFITQVLEKESAIISHQGLMADLILNDRLQVISNVLSTKS